MTTSATATLSDGTPVTYVFTEGGREVVLRGVLFHSPYWGCLNFRPDAAGAALMVGMGYDPDSLEEDGLFLDDATVTPVTTP